MGKEESSEERRQRIQERAEARRKKSSRSGKSHQSRSLTEKEKYARNRAHEKKKTNKKKDSIVTIVLLVIFGLVFLFSAYKLFGIIMFYNEGNQEYSALEELAIFSPEVDTDTDEELGYEYYYIDFEELLSINSDTIGWIRFDQPEIINYPIVQTTDNSTYLTKTFQSTDNNYGTLFVDVKNGGTFDDANTIIYGHNMKNGSMFGSLDSYQDEEYYLENPYFYIYTPDGKASKYQVCAVEIVSALSDRYTLTFASDEDYQAYIDSMFSSDYYDTGAVVDTTSKLVTLSTCTSDDDSRLIIQGVKIEEKEMVKPEE